MKVVCKKEDFKKGIRQVLTLFGRDEYPSAILNDIHLETREGKLVFAVTDLETEISSFIPCKVVKDGMAILPGRGVGKRKWNKLINSLSGSGLIIKGDREKTYLNSKMCDCEFLHGCPPEEFPTFYEGEPIKKEVLCAVSSDALKKMIERVLFAAYPDAMRPNLNGVLLKVWKGKINLVTTDGWRIAVALKRLHHPKRSRPIETLIPVKTMKILQKLLANVDGRIKIEINSISPSSILKFYIGNTIISSRLVEQHFPNYSEAIPSERALKIKIKTDSRELLRGLDTLRALENIGVSGNWVYFSIDSGGINYLKLELHKSDGHGEENRIVYKCKIENLTGSPLEKRGFSLKFLVEPLKTLSPDLSEVYLGFSPLPETPMVLSYSLPLTEARDYLYVCMPIKTGMK